MLFTTFFFVTKSSTKELKQTGTNHLMSILDTTRVVEITSNTSYHSKGENGSEKDDH
ncbi:hypothetical protein PGTUg99_010680 [Puccinia graminis f. sp. tritici]|uniref:Uncharacterized protein n=1 Tax=Puccinia graminis f. sp. tritici TaxID=56615 RepID=A0A5B0MEW4_PUCGR|nr:hypothetical protein PGTUg99_010680 [Puccinia graminis f. sp. tritici]